MLIGFSLTVYTEVSRLNYGFDKKENMENLATLNGRFEKWLQSAALLIHS